MKATAAARPYAYARPTALSSTFSLPPCSGSFGVSTPGEEGSRRKASAYKSRFVENKNHFGGRIARLRAIDGRSGARLVDLSTPSWKGKKKKKKEKKGRKRDQAYRGFFSRTGPISIEGSTHSLHATRHRFPPSPFLPFFSRTSIDFYPASFVTPHRFSKRIFESIRRDLTRG